MKYVNEFLKFNCAPDIIPIIPKQENWCKEISESMAIRKRIKDNCIDNKMENTIFDLCAGNGLTGILMAFTLPIQQVYSVDLKKRNGKYEKAKNFTYLEMNINDLFSDNTRKDQKIILIASHACKQAAIDIISIYKKYDFIKGMVMIPCCIGSHPVELFLKKEIGVYKEWCFYLKQLCNGKISFDNYILSPCNGIVEAWK
jgi:hypothetical protein